jgi:hypothetical protein
MENNLDKLFNNKLNRHEEEPSPRAWGQIHQNIQSKKKGLWVRRFSIAASIFLISTAGFVGYRTLHKVGENIELTNAVTTSKEKKSVSEKVEERIPEEIKADKIINEEWQHVSEPAIQKIEIAQEKSIPNLVATSIEKEGNVTEMKVAIAETVEKESINESNIEENNRMGSIEEAVTTPETLAENVVPENVDNEVTIENQPVVEQTRSFTPLKVIYKANKDSKLVTSDKETILNKGINKITEFSEEHVLTADRKTKLRNTKDDLLALNFGKLLNKSNKDIEN